MKIDPVSLTADLIRCPSVTPEEGGAIELLERLLETNGFSCTRIIRGQVSNLFAKWGSGKNGRVFGFNGHTDVVPPGNLKDWTVNPFKPAVKKGYLIGRGANDMKSSIAAFVTAVSNFTEINNELKSDNVELELYSIDYNNWRHEQLYPYTGLSEMLNEFNCYIFAYDDITDDDDNINNVKDNKVIDKKEIHFHLILVLILLI